MQLKHKVFQFAFKYAHRGTQFYISRQVVSNCYCAVSKTSLARSGFIARYVQFNFVPSRAAADRAPLDGYTIQLDEK